LSLYPLYDQLVTREHIRRGLV